MRPVGKILFFFHFILRKDKKADIALTFFVRKKKGGRGGENTFQIKKSSVFARRK